MTGRVVGLFVFGDQPAGALFELVVLSFQRDGLVELGIVVRFGEGEGGEAGTGELFPDGGDDHFHGGAGGEDIVYNEETVGFGGGREAGEGGRWRDVIARRDGMGGREVAFINIV